MTRHAWSERQLLCDELQLRGPDAPTLCHGWTTRDLAAHLVLREQRPDGAVGPYLPFLAKRVERERRTLASDDYAGLVTRIRAGAPAWHPFHQHRVDEIGNLVEYFVHHEDVLRAQSSWSPRELDPQLEQKLWLTLRRLARIMFRRSPAGVVLVAPGIGRYSAKLPDEHGTVIVTGSPGELVLFAYGRGDHAQVELKGEAEDVVALQGARLGFS
jgi:uncharacterized protein (TIGR03085 family)